MIEYEICKLSNDHHMKVMKCSSSSQLNNNNNGNKNSKTLILIIPGNPGIIEFYEKFAKDLNAETELDVLGISHTGHLYDEKVKNWQPLNLLTQINHKIEYIEKYLSDEDVNIILIGHSIGCYIILEVLNYMNKDLKKKVKKAFLLMPTIERMHESPNGKLLTFFYKLFLMANLSVCFLEFVFAEFCTKSFD